MKLFSSAAFFLLQLCKNVLTTEFCNGVGPGDIMVTGFNMDNPDEVLMVVLEPIEAGGTFYMTDRPWDGTAFLELENDGTLQWEVNATLSRSAELCHRCTQDGSVIDMFVPVDTGNASYTFSLASSGDTIILYCMAEPESSGKSEVRHISAITNTGGWDTNTTDSNNGTSVLPGNLPNDTVTTLGGYPNYEYDGQQAGSVSQVRAGLSTTQSWDGHEEYIDDLQTKVSFKIVNDPDGSGVSSIWVSFTVCLVSSCAMVMLI
jgi:hypothetical protein